MLVTKILFAVFEIITGLFFVRGFADKETNTFGKLFCGIGIIELIIFAWIVANRGFF